jgi:hypothetical protein
MVKKAEALGACRTALDFLKRNPRVLVFNIPTAWIYWATSLLVKPYLGLLDIPLGHPILVKIWRPSASVAARLKKAGILPPRRAPL